jgi:hypothetical protein
LPEIVYHGQFLRVTLLYYPCNTHRQYLGSLGIILYRSNQKISRHQVNGNAFWQRKIKLEMYRTEIAFQCFWEKKIIVEFGRKNSDQGSKSPC